MKMRKLLPAITAWLLPLAAPAAQVAEGPTAAELKVRRDTTFALWSTYKKTLKKHPEVSILAPALPAGVHAEENVAYTVLDTPDGARPLRCDIYRPDNDSVLPAVLMIHGGGWNSGNRGLQTPLAQRLAAAGFVAVPVEYRLIPEALYPAGLHDIKTAIRFLRANAGRFGINPERIAVAGCSAGAQLATLAGVTNGSARHEGDGKPLACGSLHPTDLESGGKRGNPGEKQGNAGAVSSDVQAVVSIDGIATFLTDSNLQSVKEHIKKKGSLPVNAQWLGGVYEDSPDNWEEASALNWITERSAPVCFINSELPRYSEGRDVLRARYAALGIATEAHRVGAPFHPFWFFHPYAERTLAAMIPFLTRVLK